jgi:hypothetical protein
MEAAFDCSGGNGVFAAAINANYGIVAAASTIPAQFAKTTTIATATIGQRRHCRRCNCIIYSQSHRRIL